MEIKIGKSARMCYGCERHFSHEETLISLVRIQSGALVREDYCEGCWSGPRGLGAFSVWSARYIDPKVAEQQPPEVFSPLRRIFYEAVESDARDQLAVAYLAAQLLRRQKIFRLLKESDAVDGEVRLTLYLDRSVDKLIEVRDPNLSYAELDSGRHVLLSRLAELESAEEQNNAQAGEI